VRTRSPSATWSRLNFEYVPLATRSYKCSTSKTKNLTLHVWRQRSATASGQFVTYEARDVSFDMSFLEMLDVVNEGLIAKGEDPIAFDRRLPRGYLRHVAVWWSTVSPTAPARPHVLPAPHARVPERRRAVDRAVAARAFPVLKDLIVDRTALDKIIQAGGYISSRRAARPDANAIPIEKESADLSMDAAACIGCGACVAACPNGSAMLFTSAKVSQLGLLPQGQPERYIRVQKMVGGDGRLRLRDLQQPPRVRGGLSQGHQHRVHPRG